MAATLQHEAATLSFRIQTASTRKHHPLEGKADDALTFKLDQSTGAGQYENQIESLRTGSAATLFKFRLDDADIPSEMDAEVFAKILKTDTLSLLWVTDKIVAELSEEDLQFFRNEYKSGKLHKEFNNWKTYFR